MSTRLANLSGWAGLALLGGCAVHLPGPPPADVPAGWSEAPTDPALPAPALPGPEWWSGFGSTELLALQRQALAANADLAAAVARVAQARGAARVAGAGRWPTLDLDAGAQRSKRGGGGDFGDGFGGAGDGDAADALGGRDRAASNRYQVGAAARYELDLWGRQRVLARGGQARTDARAADLRAAQLSVQAEVALAYFRALALTERARLADARMALAQERLALIQARRRYGSASDLEVRAQESALAALRASVPTLARDARLQHHALAVLLGLPAQTAPALDGRFAQLRAVAVPVGLPATVLARRPDVDAAQAELIGAQADAAGARAALLPTFGLTAQGGASSSALGDVLASDGRFWTLGFDVLTPLFEGGRLRGARDQADAQLTERLALYRATVLTALREVEDALATRAQAADTRQAQTQALDAATATHTLAGARLAAGATDRTALVDAHGQALEARDADVTARLAELEASVALFRAVGGGYACAATPCDGADARLECTTFSGCGVEQPGSSSGS